MTTRRKFLEHSSVSLACAATAASAYAQGSGTSPSEKVGVGVIGVGGMGRSHVRELLEQDDIEIVGVADVDGAHRDQTVELVRERFPEVRAYHDYRSLLDHDTIDGVVIATPDHWHAHAALESMQAGKDVYCQKPLSHNLAEGRAMVAAAEKHQCVTQMGNQIHATENYHRVAEIVQSGVLGKIALVRIWMTANHFPNGHGHTELSAPPNQLDYDRWIGPAPMRPYSTLRSHFNWRYFWDYGGGHFLDFVCHLHDLVHWGMGVTAPLAVSGIGRRLLIDDDTDTPNSVLLAYEYPEFNVEWSIMSTNGHGHEGRGAGVMFHGTNATLHCHYNDFQIVEEAGHQIELPEPSLPRSPGHLSQWIDHIRTREACECPFEYGHRLTSVGHLGNIAIRSGDRIEWDAENEAITNHPSANQWLAREYRKGYELPMV